MGGIFKNAYNAVMIEFVFFFFFFREGLVLNDVREI